jgi:allantoinase
MTRDFVGYGAEPPHAGWPGDARIAVNFVINYEEGSENRFEDGCRRRETAGDAASQVPLDPPQRDLANESTFEFGSRVGVRRLFRLFDRFDVKPTVFARAVALERNPAVGPMEDAPQVLSGRQPPVPLHLGRNRSLALDPGSWSGR